MGNYGEQLREASKAKADKRRAHVRALRAAGLTWAQIGKQLGVSRARAHQIGRISESNSRIDSIGE